MSLGKDVTVVEMQALICRAGLATETGNSAEIMAYVRGLTYPALAEEYHRAVVTLGSRGLLSQREYHEVAEYARDLLSP